MTARGLGRELGEILDDAGAPPAALVDSIDDTYALATLGQLRDVIADSFDRLGELEGDADALRATGRALDELGREWQRLRNTVTDRMLAAIGALPPRRNRDEQAWENERWIEDEPHDIDDRHR